ncbi:protein lin-52 homolog isoform X2 [Nilaparvata lugens]|nr:protein lin-52 homolog isoform X2 [Nilaparvata lugens]XP_039289972.1 protein lin-52 homolog isoform X2 [Nilaparvata lugens]
MTALDESLLSLEKLDRTSPELWPEQIPGVSDYMHLNALSTHPLPKLWNKPLDEEDYVLMTQLSTLSHGALIAEVKKLHDAAYKLGLEEAKEMTKGKYLNVLSKKKYNSNLN